MKNQNPTSLNSTQHRVSRAFTLANRWRFTLNSLIQLFALGSLGFLAACAPTVSSASSEGNVGDVVAYDGPKARLVVGNLNCRVSGCGSVGGSMADSLTTALFRSNRFVLLERDNVNAIQSESALLQSNVVQEGADLVVSGAITAFEPNAGGNAGTINLPVLGGIRLGNSEAYVAIDLRLIDVRTRRIVNIASVEGRSSSFNVGGYGGGFIGGTYLGGSLSSYSNAPMGQAIAVLLENAVREMAKLVPIDYYRVPNNGVVAQPTVTTTPSATNNTVSSVTIPSSTKTPTSSATTASATSVATSNANSSGMKTSQQSDIDGCIGETFSNGIWKFRVASMESSVEDNYKGYRIVVEFRNASNKKISLSDVGVSTSSEKLFYLVLGDEQTLVPTDVTSPNWSSEAYKVIPQGALIRHEFFFRIYSNTSKPSKLLVDIDPTKLPKDLGLTYTVANPSFKVDLTCKK
jgi:curli biogenesis system outer membrane secretion channel CsgG